ncbi:hypothetical protein [Fodinibius sediminis]|uniref:TonB dependent receptor n=1 Tax=Fodinibius sediminis TaxID=1214077 RepID=A0A521AQ37_9BACT|nr:hypothetical protein [Fodinibius sediminis]SMO36939.1 hypothetical protein SAMN06265218_101270 [Fodinibius sediminis]
MKRISTVTFLSIILAIAALPSAAQDRQGGDDDAMLPEIDPQDIEIRSEFKARFPGLRRQPILGFEPASRTYSVDPDRMPYIESREEVVADLPISELTRPDPPAYTQLHYSPDINAFGRLGAGSYVSPEATFWGVTRLNEKSYIGGDLDLSSSEGHLDNQKSSFRFLNADAEFATKLDDDTRLGFDLGLENSFNHLYGIESTALSIPDSPRKEYGGFNLGADLQRLKNGVAGWNVQANMRYYEARVYAGDLAGMTDEGVYNASLSKRWAGAHPQEMITAKLGGTLGDYNNSITADQWMTGQAGVEYQRLFNYEMNLTVDASVYYGSNAFEEKVYFGPTATIELPIFEGAILTGEIGAKPYVQTAEDLHSTNRFLSSGNDFRHTYRMYGAGELELKYSEVGSLSGGIRYEDISNQPVFERNALSSQPDELLFYRVRYADATRVRIYAGASHQVVPEKFWLHGKAYAQLPELKDGGRVPFSEKLGLNSGFGLRLFDRATIEGWADYRGLRKNDQGQNLNDYLLLGGQLDLLITDNIGVYAKVVNLLDQEYQKWEGYVERPMQIYGGVTFKL